MSPGALGAFGANHHLRQSLVFLDMPMMQQPEAYLGNAGALFDADGKLIDEIARRNSSAASWPLMPTGSRRSCAGPARSPRAVLR